MQDFVKLVNIKNMKIKDNFNIKGEITFIKRRVPKWLIPFERLGMYNFVNKHSPIISQHKYTNLVCTVGKDTIINRLCGTVKIGRAHV